MIGKFPAEAIDADLFRELPCLRHFSVAVVPLEQDVAPVELRQVAAGFMFFVGHRAKIPYGNVELAALAVLHIALGAGAVD